MALISDLFYLDRLAAILMVMAVFIGLCVGCFAVRYMRGDTHYMAFFRRLSLLVISVMVMVSADHLWVLFGSWCTANLLLVRLMIHKPGWRAAKASGLLASRYYLMGALCIAAAFTLLTLIIGETSIQQIVRTTAGRPPVWGALILLLIGAMTQSAIWPFHRWLTSSLNSPTPVSAIMHAGLVNGGGFLLVRFAPLYLQATELLTVIFVAGIVTAVLGTLWKLMQSDIKRMLACSTMGQMGFMLAQCGLGLFPAAVAHLVWHGLFKAYLFLASGGAEQVKRLDPGYPPSLPAFFCALIGGAAGSLAFGFVSGKSLGAGDSTVVLMFVAFLAASQLALPIVRHKPLYALPFALGIATLAGLAYGASVRLIVWILEPLNLMQPQALNGFHILGMLVLTVPWLSMLFMRNRSSSGPLPQWVLRGYVTALNAGQPHPATITAHRNHYYY